MTILIIILSLCLSFVITVVYNFFWSIWHHNKQCHEKNIIIQERKTREFMIFPRGNIERAYVSYAGESSRYGFKHFSTPYMRLKIMSEKGEIDVAAYNLNKELLSPDEWASDSKVYIEPKDGLHIQYELF